MVSNPAVCSVCSVCLAVEGTEDFNDWHDHDADGQPQCWANQR